MATTCVKLVEMINAVHAAPPFINSRAFTTITHINRYTLFCVLVQDCCVIISFLL